MTETPPDQAGNAHDAWLYRYALVSLILTVLLLYTGGFTTTIRAGMVFIDWPLSNGSLNPDGWLQNTAMLAEHSHRLTGMTVGMFIMGLMIWVLVREKRTWVRRLAMFSFCLVLAQGLLGGARVLLNSIQFAIIHGCVAQSFLCVLITLVLSLSPMWRKGSKLAYDGYQHTSKIRYLGYALISTTVIQLIVAATMRHMDAGLAIPTFPFDPDGLLIPTAWTAGIAIHFTHRFIAIVLTAIFVVWLYAIYRNQQVPKTIETIAFIAWTSLIFQILLGISVIWMERPPLITTLHMLNGAAFLGLVWTANLLMHYPRITLTHHNQGSQPTIKIANDSESASNLAI